MRACSSASGGVMFFPDEDGESAVQSTPISYSDLIDGEARAKTPSKRLLGEEKTDLAAEKAA